MVSSQNRERSLAEEMIQRHTRETRQKELNGVYTMHYSNQRHRIG